MYEATAQDAIQELSKGTHKIEISCLDPGKGWLFWWNKCNKNDDGTWPCAFTNITTKPPRRIHICPRAFGGKCGPLSCVLAHELIHVFGLRHADKTDSDYQDNVKFFECVKLLKGCEKYTATHAIR